LNEGGCVPQPDVEAGSARVTVRFFGAIKHSTGEWETVVDLPARSKVIDLLKILSEKYGTGFSHLLFGGMNQVHPGLLVLVDGLPVYHGEGLDTVLEKGDVDMVIVPAMDGG
jgi:molybdopterin converting factor small subunit